MFEHGKELKIKKSEKTYRWKYEPAQQDKLAALSSSGSIPRLVAEILIKKGITDKSELDTFLNSPLSAIRSPFELLNMDKAAQRIADAVMNREKICIYGDYDVDGITSTAVLYLFLKQINADVIYYIPNRLEEGYGLNMDAIHDIASKKVALIVTVDCGISAEAEVAAAAAAGIDVIITDHHQPSERLPLAAYTIVDPMQEGDTYPYKALAGVGVSFKVILAVRSVLRKRNYFSNDGPNAKSFLDIVTLGTIADVMPLTDENRVMVKQGLRMMSNGSARIGIDELKTLSGIAGQDMKAFHVGFQLAPRINAMGRMGSSDKSLRLLLTDNRAEAKLLARELDSENKFRQAIERDILTETFNIIESGNLAIGRKGLVISAENWHPGVIGIVASRVVDRYFRPTVILSSDGEMAKGSARSIPCFHLYDGLAELSDILISFGGHKYAAGVKVSADKVAEFTERFNNIVESRLTDDDLIPEINIDAIAEAHELNFDTVKWLAMLEPYGAGNKEPLICLKNVEKYQQPGVVGKEGAHIKCYFEKNGMTFDCIGYNMKHYLPLVAETNAFDIIFTLAVNKWRTNTSIQLNLKDIRKAGK